VTMRVAPDGWYRRRVPVRFRDLDAMGHAHHTLPLVYLEEARAAFWRELNGSVALDSIDYVMAEITVRFHARIRYPAEVEVALAVDHVGGKSFTTLFELRGAVPAHGSASGELLASGRAVQVAYDYGKNATKPIGPRIRATLVAWRDALAQNSSAMEADTAPITPPST
jgi:acyl-CoA thioester hydrolase